MNSIEDIEHQTPYVVPKRALEWMAKTSLGQLNSEYRGLLSHLREQLGYALDEHNEGMAVHSTRRSHRMILDYSERLRLVSAEIARRVGGVSANNKPSGGTNDL